MRERRKEALKLLAIGVPMLAYGAYAFELGGVASPLVSAAVAVTLTFGTIGTIGGLIMFFTKNSLGMVETKPKAEVVEEEEPNDSWREDTVWEKEEPVQEEEPKLKMPA